MSDAIFRLREGFNRFAAEGHGIVVEAGEVFATADSELQKMLDLVPALERVPDDESESEQVSESESEQVETDSDTPVESVEVKA